MTTTLDDLLAEATAQTTEDASIVALLTGVKQQLDEALSGQTLSPAAQAKVNAIFATLQKNSDAITAAIAANTPSGVAPATGGGLTATTVAITSSDNPAAVGAAVTFSAAVTAQAPANANAITGAVQFMADGTSIGAANVDSTGVAAFSTSTLTAGDHSITAVYAGDANYATSTSAPLAQVIQ